MPIKYHYEIQQGGNAWFEARLGVVTASKMNLLLTPTGKPAKNEKVLDYAYKIVGERATWRMDYEYQGFEMERGQIEEDLARNIYNDKYADVRLCGFVENNDYGFKIGASPDGLVGDDGGIEIKSRLTKFQIKTVVEDVIDQQYMNQIQACLLITGRKWWDFVQYSNGMPLYVKRVFPDQAIHAAIIEACTAFDAMCKEIKSKYMKNSETLVVAPYVENVMGDEISESEK